MITINCISSEDNLRYTKWPTKLEVRPMIGEYISSLDLRHSRKIVRIEHFYVRHVEGDFSYLVLELSK